MFRFCLLCCIATAPTLASQSVGRADTVLLDGNILILDSQNRQCQALAIRDRHVIAFGTDFDIRKFMGAATNVIRLDGKTVVPGLIESHVHPLGVSREEHDQPYAELTTIPVIQEWIRKRASELPPGDWIRVPRNDITRIKERRHPTPA